MSRYPWARSFIRQTRWVAILIVVCGLVFAGFDAWKFYIQVSEQAYHPNPALTDSLLEVETSLKGSVNIITRFELSSGGPAIPNEIVGDIQVLPVYDSASRLDQAGLQLTTAKSSVDSLKTFLVTNVLNQLDDLVAQLRAHAASLSPNVATNNTPSTPPSPVVVSPGVKGLYAEDFTANDAEQRKAQLQDVQDQLGLLIPNTEKAENQAKLQASITELHRLQGLFAYLTVAAGISSPASTAPSSSDQSGTNPPAPVLAASEVADSLEEKEGIIQDTITSKWLVDDKITGAGAVLQQEQTAAAAASQAVSKLYIDFYETLFIIIVCTGILAYLVEILADILQAHIDGADNSFPIYQPSGEGEQ